MPDLLAILATLGFFAAAGVFAAWLDRLDDKVAP
jgi:hypothetical protein